MKKVVFSVTNARNQSDKKLSGFSFLPKAICYVLAFQKKNNKTFFYLLIELW